MTMTGSRTTDLGKANCMDGDWTTNYAREDARCLSPPVVYVVHPRVRDRPELITPILTSTGNAGSRDPSSDIHPQTLIGLEAAGGVESLVIVWQHRGKG